MYVVAHRVGGRIDVQLWSVPSSGAPVLLTSAKASGTSVSLHPISSGIFAMAVTDANGRITVTTWRAISFMGGHWFQAVDSETDADVGPMRVALTRVQTNFPQASYLVAVSAQPGATQALAYAVDPSTGELTATDAAKFGWMITTATVSPAPVAATESELSAPAYVAIAGKDSGGAQKLNYIKINGQGKIVYAGQNDTDTMTTKETDLAQVGSSGLATVHRTLADNLMVTVWESRRNSDDTITALKVAEHVDTEGHGNAVCNLSGGFGEADLVTGVVGQRQAGAEDMADRSTADLNPCHHGADVAERRPRFSVSW